MTNDDFQAQLDDFNKFFVAALAEQRRQLEEFDRLLKIAQDLAKKF